MTTQVDLTDQVKGVLPHTDGGTDLSSPGAAGNVLQSNGTSWISAAQPYDVWFAPNVVMGSGTVYRIGQFPRTVIFPGNFAGSQCHVSVAPATTQTVTINKNGSGIGTITITSAGVVTFASTGGSAVTYNGPTTSTSNDGDRLSFTNQAGADPSMLIEITLAGTR